MRLLYHCMYKEPVGNALLATCFRNVNGEEKNYLYAATHLTKALAFSFSYHDNEVLMNSGIDGSDNEMVIVCGGQATLDKKRHIRVYAFPDDGFIEIPKARQAVSENPMPFSKAEKILETRDINDLMEKGLQIIVLPGSMEDYSDQEGLDIVSKKYWRQGSTHGDIVSAIMSDLGARWINLERNIGICPVLKSEMPELPDGKKMQPRLSGPAAF